MAAYGTFLTIYGMGELGQESLTVQYGGVYGHKQRYGLYWLKKFVTS